MKRRHQKQNYEYHTHRKPPCCRVHRRGGFHHHHRPRRFDFETKASKAHADKDPVCMQSNGYSVK
jgi:hypothetical protein